jgi:hypothetical protein
VPTPLLRPSHDKQYVGSHDSTPLYQSILVLTPFDMSRSNIVPEGVVTFHRQVLKTPVTLSAAERDASGDFRYVNIKVDIDNPLEDDAPLGALQLDFANKVIGGGVLDRVRRISCSAMAPKQLSMILINAICIS